MKLTMRDYYHRARLGRRGAFAATIVGTVLPFPDLQLAALEGIGLILIEAIFDVQRSIADKRQPSASSAYPSRTTDLGLDAN